MKDCYQLNIVTAPTTWVVSLAEARNYIKAIATVTTDDELITILIKSATLKVEKHINRKLVTQSWRMTLDSQPDTIDYPFGNLSSITSIVTVDEDDVTETDESGKVHTRTGDNGQTYLKVGQSYATTIRTHELMKIVFVVGYGAITAVPPDIKTAMLELISAMYYNRDASIKDVPNAEFLLDPYIIFQIKA